jgi:hypothetical protein
MSFYSKYARALTFEDFASMRLTKLNPTPQTADAARLAAMRDNILKDHNVRWEEEWSQNAAPLILSLVQVT